jgi:hypothetical protein
MPDLQLPTPTEFIANFKARCVALSQGRLNDFAPASVLSVLAEVMAQSIEEDLQEYLEKVFPLIVARSWGLLGFTQKSGARAIGSVRALLAEVNSQPFALPRGYRFSAGGQVFETTVDLVVPANTDTANPANYAACRVGIVALLEGDAGNQPIQQCEIINAVVGLAGLFFDERTAGGQTAEPFETFADRVSSTLRQAVGDPTKSPIVTATEHETVAKEILGAGSVAIAVTERTPQGQVQTAATTVYILAPGGIAPTDAQMGQLLSIISPRAPLATGRLYYAPLFVSTINIEVGVKALPAASPEALAAAINTALRKAFGLQATGGMLALDIGRANAICYALEGWDYGQVYWGFQGDPILEARMLQIPFLPGSQSKTNAVTVGTVTATFSTGLKIVFTS